jgi:hypothetical protein
MSALRYITPILSLVLFFVQQQTRTFEITGDIAIFAANPPQSSHPRDQPGSGRFYASYGYEAKSFDILSIDPATGNAEVF